MTMSGCDNDERHAAKRCDIRGSLVVLGCNIVLIFALGLNQAIGPFFVELMRHFDEGAGKTSLIVTLSVFFVTITGPVANLMTKRFGCRVTVLCGGVISTAGHLLSSFAQSVSTLCLTHGVLVGFGYGLTYSPSVGMVSKHFKKRHAIANALAYTGSGLGIFIFPPLLQLLIDTYGWRGSFLVFASVSANICVCGALFVEPPPTPGEEPQTAADSHLRDTADVGTQADMDEELGVWSESREWGMEMDLNCNARAPVSGEDDKNTANEKGVKIDGNIQYRRHHISASGVWQTMSNSLDLYLFRESPPFVLMVISTFFLGFGHYIAVVYLLPRAESLQFANAQGNAFLVSVMGICSVIGRSSHGFLLECKAITGPRLYIFCLLAAGVASLLSGLAKSYVTYAVYCALFGLSSGMYLPLIAVILSDFLGREKLISSLGLATASLGIGLVGTPIAGWIYDLTENYDNVYYLAGISLCLAGLLIFLVPYLDGRKTERNSSREADGLDNKGYDHASDDVTNKRPVLSLNQ